MRISASKLDSSIALLAIIVMSMYLRYSDIFMVKLVVEILLAAQLYICVKIGNRIDTTDPARFIALLVIDGGLIFLTYPVWMEFKNIDQKEIFMPLIALLTGAIVWCLSDRRDINHGRDRRKGAI